MRQIYLGVRMLIDQIGETAGRIWQALHQKGPLGLSALKKQAGAPDFILNLALGWLAREGKIEFAPAGRSYSVQLK